ncbi:Uncharacterized protein DBV15_05674 [Temnothorax longispinosus]|uniref:Uncharacterized protein n=1 Tax=Temnothorax longispinosus TaxID=300112 RepID=A0A4S2JN81_9HYME|nr:Uncharacterized protein DBV15_05674 [Temnothorax longispinosus]
MLENDWHRSWRDEKKNPLSRYLFSTHVASIGRDLAVFFFYTQYVNELEFLNTCHLVTTKS